VIEKLKASLDGTSDPGADLEMRVVDLTCGQRIVLFAMIKITSATLNILQRKR
jgi:hypothetical protein